MNSKTYNRWRRKFNPISALSFIDFTSVCFLLLIKNILVQTLPPPATSANAKSSNHLCPSCGFEYLETQPSKLIHLHKIFECSRVADSTFYKSHYSSLSKPLYSSNNNNNNNNINNVTSYICKCKYAKETKTNCSVAHVIAKHVKPSSKQMKDKLVKKLPHRRKTNTLAIDVDNVNVYLSTNYSMITRPCLIVHVGMAIKGSNLMFRQWTGKENCFNLCLNTTIRNGFAFDCRSFEHWHSECPYTQQQHDQSQYANGDDGDASTFQSTKLTQSRKVCASFNNDNEETYSAIIAAKKRSNNNNNNNKRNGRSYVKIDYCVLSDMTIMTAGNDFTSNNAVTYYELLCQSNFAKIGKFKGPRCINPPPKKIFHKDFITRYF
jgi:hypothetical protein